MFITFEGVDGSGKSLQSRRVSEALEAQGREVVLTREPGGTKGAEELRELVLNGETDRWSSMSELLIFTAARRDHCERIIWPAIERGAVVICDRFIDSTRLYQGLVSEDMREAVDMIHATAIGTEADLTLIFDINPEKAFERMKGRDETDMRFEGHGLEFQKTRRTGFHQLQKSNPNRYTLINADQPIMDVTREALLAINKRIDL